MKTALTFFVILMIAATLAGWEPVRSEAAAQQNRITVRIERFPRPPYSGATYYIYERGGEVICTKLEVCNKYDDCETQYKKGVFKEEEDIETGEPYGREKAVVIPTAKLRKHVCLTRFKLLSK
jgi:hypothetical protein